MRALAMTGIETAAMMPSIRSGSLIRETPPWARMSAGTRSSAMTATAPASSAILACSAVTTSMITPPLSISAMPRLTRAVPQLGGGARDGGLGLRGPQGPREDAGLGSPRCVGYTTKGTHGTRRPRTTPGSGSAGQAGVERRDRSVPGGLARPSGVTAFVALFTSGPRPDRRRAGLSWPSAPV